MSWNWNGSKSRKHYTHVFIYEGKPVAKAGILVWRKALKRVGSERTGDKIVVDSLKTAIGRITIATKQAAKEQGINWIPFTFHDLKRKGVSDTSGNKQDASGHRTASMMNVYDVRMKTVKPSNE